MKNFINASPPNSGTRENAWQAILLGALLAVSAGAQAAGTLSDTDITNLAKLSYNVGGTPQNEICSSEVGNTLSNGGTSGTTCTSGSNGASNTTFKVDNKVDVLVAESGGTATTVVAGQAVATTVFTVTNEGNTTQDFALSVANLANGTVLFGNTDNFTATSCTVSNIVISSGTMGTYTALDQHINALTPDGVATVTVTCSIPLGVVTADAAVIYLGATARADDVTNALGGVLTQSVANGQNTVEIVFGDDAGSDDATIVGSGAGVRDATHSARDVYVVATSALTVTKTMSTVCDPLNGNVTPFNIPGALVRWSVVIANGAGAGASATLQQVSDALNANTTFNTDFGVGATAAACSEATDVPTSAAGSGFRVSCVANVGGTRACHTTPQFFTTADDNDAVDLEAGPLVNVNYSLALPAEAGHTAGELKAGESVTVQFQVYIN